MSSQLSQIVAFDTTAVIHHGGYGWGDEGIARRVGGFSASATVRLDGKAFAAFASLAADEKPAHFVEFANTFGALTAQPASNDEAPSILGDFQWLWQREVRAASAARRLWCALSEKREGAVRAMVGTNAGRIEAVRELATMPEAATVAGGMVPLDERVQWATQRQPLGTTRSGIWTHIGAPKTYRHLGHLVLGGVIGVRLSLDRREPWLGADVYPRLHGVGPTMRVEPRSNLAALWLAFALEVTGGGRYRQCRQCPEVFHVGGPGRARRDKELCSRKCIGAAQTERNTKARSMARAGKTRHEIARALGMKLTAVQRLGV